MWFGVCHFPRNFVFTMTACILIVLAVHVPHIQN
jgi:hypothetical protein